MTLFGEVYIAPKNEMHIASGSLYFESGKIITERGSDAGTLSFAKGTHWEKADHDTHVDGFIRFYDASEFSFPLGHNNVFQPIHVSDFSGSSHFDVAYHHQGHGINQSEDTIVTVSDNYFWELRNPKGKGFVMLSWNTFSNIHKLLERSPSPENALDLITIGGFDGEQWIPIESKLSENPLDGGSSSSLLSGLIKSKKTVDMMQVVRLVERLTGQKLVHLADMNGKEIENHSPVKVTQMEIEIERLKGENQVYQKTLKNLLNRLDALERKIH